MSTSTRKRICPTEAGDPLAIAVPLAAWYAEAKRDLPWRHTRDPYRIWLSEIMAQQTQISVVIPYYERFLRKYPTVHELAAAPLEEVLERWAGLGYYSRGRNLHRAASRIVNEWGGEFPSDGESIRSLPGIGDYTAAAISSIAFGRPRAVVDGNVERVLSRHGAIANDPKRGDGKRAVRKSAEQALDSEHPGDHNQAMMELGALICTPRQPHCDLCPIAESCRGLATGEPEQFPPPRERRSAETQHWVALVVGDREESWVIDRGREEELLPGHRGVPLIRIPGSEPPSEEKVLQVAGEALARVSENSDLPGTPLEFVRHSITYRRLMIYPVRFPGPLLVEGATKVVAKNRGKFPALFRKIFDSIDR